MTVGAGDTTELPSGEEERRLGVENHSLLDSQGVTGCADILTTTGRTQTAADIDVPAMAEIRRSTTEAIHGGSSDGAPS